MLKSSIIFLLIFCGILVIIYQIATYFLDSFQYTLSHDGENPEDYFSTRCVYVGLGFGLIVLAFSLKYFRKQT
ncbi:hypothetical protein CHRY9390_00410 [Chryseobacterium aquaeductus]|uniref:Uncharacterized protein n=1 Tax=Chryseobacterium aquaeductus TaxID=2675056 RepID=A0A9N8MKV9_9FLAO|nr:hypothetical protein CHRY9390_00410 [Chryseobacterium potabilaquae]CAD7798939.1 hypothetical protein CHRY9390_00410 [Chryseobacterium aquaeductus]